MKTLETTATAKDGKLTVQLPPDFGEGQYQIVLVLEEKPVTENKPKQDFSDFPVHDFGPWPANLSLRREDMYDDWGR